MALGPILGGALVQLISWRAIFWINVPIGIAAIALTYRYVPESRGERPRRVDAIGQILVALALGALTSALIEGPHAGWRSPWIIAGFALAGLAIASLIPYERRRIDPLIDPRFFRSLPFASATVLAVVAFTTFNGALFLSSLYLQETRGLAPATAGACLLPIAIALVVCSPLSGRLVGAGRARLAIVVAGVATVISAGLLVELSVATALPLIVASFGVFGIGLGSINAPITNAAVSGMPRAQAGVASALASTSRQVGATLGVAIAGTLSASDAHDPAFAESTHPFWWLVIASGLAIIAIGIAATGERARRTVQRVANLVDA
jgi:predicted MFS family arabinose efflux permease